VERKQVLVFRALPPDQLARLQAVHDVTVADISLTRLARANMDYGLAVSRYMDATEPWPFEDGAFDSVVLGEILEHLENPGPAIAEAHRVARLRVVVSVPLNGWADPTHRWRIRMDHLEDREQQRDGRRRLRYCRGVCTLNGMRMCEIPGDEPKRIGGASKMSPLYNGSCILLMIFRLYVRKWLGWAI